MGEGARLASHPVLQLVADRDGSDLLPVVARAVHLWRGRVQQEQVEHGQQLITWGEYLVSADFWNRTLQNWQSEFLAVGSMIALSIYLRQRGSSESKPVGAPHQVSALESE